MIEVYGMSGCTTVRNAVKWLEAQGADFEYTHFPKRADLSADLAEWIGILGHGVVLNTKAQNFKKLPEEAQRTLLADQGAAIAAMVENPRLIKRPLIRNGDQMAAGFKEAEWQALLG